MTQKQKPLEEDSKPPNIASEFEDQDLDPSDPKRPADDDVQQLASCYVRAPLFGGWVKLVISVLEFWRTSPEHFLASFK